MALPSKKRPKSEKRLRRAVNKLKKVNHSKCSSCGRPIKSHQLCGFCGKYKGIEIIKIKISKKEKGSDKETRKETKK